MTNWRNRGFVADSDVSDEDDVGTIHEETETQVEPPDQIEFQDIDLFLPDDGTQGDGTINLPGPSFDARSTEYTSENVELATDPDIRGSQEENHGGHDDRENQNERRSVFEAENQCAIGSASGAANESPEPLDASTTFGAYVSERAATAEILDGELTSSPLSDLMTLDSADFSERGTPSPEEQRDFSRGSLPNLETINEVLDRHTSQANFSATRLEGLDSEKLGGRYRSLRSRNPIQLHPYILEGERYRQFLRARGVQPLRIAQAQREARETNEDAGREIQSSESDDNSQSLLATRESQNMMLSPPVSSSPLPPLLTAAPLNSSPIEGTQTSNFDQNDEFPDIECLLRRPHDAFQHGHKRQKTSHSHVRDETQGHSTTREQQIQETSYSSPRQGSRHATFDIPPSPPPSKDVRRTIESQHTAAGYGIPLNSSPSRRSSEEESDTNINTPVRHILTKSGAEQRSRDPSTSTSSKTTSPRSEPEEESSHLRSFQRKIKGVLPASWLRLDKKAVNLTNVRDRHYSPLDTSSRPGIARRKSSPRDRAANIRLCPTDVVEISDSSDASDDNSPQQTDHKFDAAVNAPTKNAYSNVTSFVEDFEEEDSIDAMLPPPSRKPSSSVKHSNEKRETEFPIIYEPRKRKSTVSARLKDSASNPFFRRQPRITESIPGLKNARRGQVRPERTSIPHLSVLDSPQHHGSEVKPAPHFLRVAKRQVRSRKNKGRHSPTAKVFRLASRQDTEEVQTILQDWRHGNIRQNVSIRRDPTTPRRGRSPLKERWGNEQTIQSPVLERPIQAAAVHHPAKRTAHKEIRRNPLIRPTSKSHHPHLKGKIFSNPLLPENSHSLRPGQLESTSSKYRSQRRRADFGQRLQHLDHLYDLQLLNHTSRLNEPLGRFLADEDTIKSTPSSTAVFSSRPPTGLSNQRIENAARRGRKRQPRRLDADIAEYRQAPANFIDLECSPTTSPAVEITEQNILRGLGPYGTEYTVSFDIQPLKAGTFFHESTFIGSGLFAKALNNTSQRNYNAAAGLTVVHLGSAIFRWGVWNDAVSSNLGSIFETAADQSTRSQQISQDAEQGLNKPSGGECTDSLLRLTVQYLNESLWFADPIDRSSFLRRLLQLLNTIFEDTILDQVSIKDGSGHCRPPWDLLRARKFALVLAYQCYRIADDTSVAPDLKTEIQHVMEAAAIHLVRLLIRIGLKEIRSFYEKNQRYAKREAGIRKDDSVIEGWVTTIHILAQPTISRLSFWDIVTAELLPSNLGTEVDVVVLERLWYSVFTFLPLCEFDECGILAPGRRFRIPNESWPVPASLVRRLGAIYNSSRTGQPATFNSYFRAVCSRCHHLIKEWGWRKCESIIETLFDFFASNNLAHLKHEESLKSPQFLEQLHNVPDLEIEPSDRSFHIFLKIIGLGIKGLCQLYPEKRIRNIIFRLMPNHGRQYPKEESVHQDDLASLRNHHDLLCTLYWISPPAFRPQVNSIRDLVYPETSHREACHISIRAWNNLIKFQLSTAEDTCLLQPFNVWHSRIIDQILGQHSRAKTEAEAQFTLISSGGVLDLSTNVLESTISSNQQQLEVVLSDALLSLKNSLSLTKTPEAATTLLSSRTISSIFNLFDASKYRINNVVSLALEVVLEYIQTCSGGDKTRSTQEWDDDSQEYGDWSWSIPDGTDPIQPGRKSAEYLHDSVHHPLTRLVSNAFGADIPANESILSKIVDTWVSTADFLVTHGIKMWDNYINLYSREAWTSLRKTEQSRKFSGYYLSKVMERDFSCYQDHRSFFLSSWMTSIVERSSMLKFQHLFTNSLLNLDRRNPLLQNLPFWTHGPDSIFSITPAEFLDRRLSMISSLLSNMRETLDCKKRDSVNEALEMQGEYADLLRQLQGSMKTNFEELRQDTSISGAYVQFVHCVVEFLQQHTAELYPVDKFFTDSSAFPLPATDPSYIVGRLKNYGLRLSGSGVHKQLVVFFQSISERAAVDGAQPDLAGQVHSAMSNTFEQGEDWNPTLRSFLVHAIFPAYIESALVTDVGWIFARPIFEASRRMLESLFLDFDITNESSVKSVSAALTTLLETCPRSFRLSDNLFRNLDLPSTVTTFRRLFSTITAALPIVDYIYRVSPGIMFHIIPTIQIFCRLSARLSLHDEPSTSQRSQTLLFLGPPASHTPSPAPFAEIHKFCTHELHSTLKTKWYRHDNEYYLHRGNSRIRAHVEPLDMADEKQGLRAALREFEDVLGRMDGISAALENLVVVSGDVDDDQVIAADLEDDDDDDDDDNILGGENTSPSGLAGKGTHGQYIQQQREEKLTLKRFRRGLIL
ncbi:MAG: hypothetical protein M1837_005875 [Sclerophora amabilis]|nr:MAG: hypothetical protein M1837_005875 [Sclerophora amabilis]